MIGVEDIDPPPNEIHEEVFAAIMGRKSGGVAWRTEGAAGDRCDRVMMNWAPKPAVSRRALGCWPAVVGSSESLVDFFPGPLPHVVDHDPARAGLDGEGERVAQAECPDRPV